MDEERKKKEKMDNYPICRFLGETFSQDRVQADPVTTLGVKDA